jgi:hypothetical protein
MFSRRLMRELRAAVGWSALLPLPALAGFALLEGLAFSDASRADQAYLALRDTLLLLPLSAALSSASLMSVEIDERFAELRDTYPQPLWRQALWRTALAVLLAALSFTLGWGVFALLFHNAALAQAMLPALPAVVFLLGCTLWVDHASGNYWAAAGAALAWWLVEIQTRGKLTGPLFLFNAIWPVADPSANAALLCLLGAAFLAANLGMGELRRRGALFPRGGRGSGRGSGRDNGRESGRKAAE